MRPRLSSLIARGRLFFDSYIALWLIFAIRATSATRWLFLALAALGAIDVVRLLAAARYRSRRLGNLEDVEDKGPDAAAYIATYLLPFLAGPPSDVKSLLSMLIYFLVVLAVALQSGLALVNPTLYLIGYRISEATLRGGKVLVIHRQERLADGEHRMVALMGQAGYMVVP